MPIGGNVMENVMVNWGFGHCALFVKDYEKSIEFYTKTLGFKNKFSLYNNDGKLWLTYIEFGKRLFLELYPIQEMKNIQIEADRVTDFHPPEGLNIGHICLTVDSLKPVALDLQSKGITLWSGPSYMGRKEKIPYEPHLCMDAAEIVYIDDPDGNSIEIMQYTKDSPQVQEPSVDRINGVQWGFGHCALFVKDYEKSMEFYTKILGFKNKFSLYNNAGDIWLTYVEFGKTKFIEIYPKKETKGIQIEEDRTTDFYPPEGKNIGHICLTVDNLMPVARDLQGKGVTLWSGPSYMGRKEKNPYEPHLYMDAAEIFYIDDPDGNSIEVMQYTKDSPQLKEL